MRKYKNDIVLVIILLVVALAFSMSISFLNKKQANYVRVTVDGKEELLLDISKNSERNIGQNEFTNIIKIENGSVSVTDADCADKLCVYQGSIEKNGESIICLPHKVVISVVSGEEREVDAVSN